MGFVFWGRERRGNSGEEKGREARVIIDVGGVLNGGEGEGEGDGDCVCDCDSDGDVKFGQTHVSL